MKIKYSKPTIVTIPYTFDVAFGKRCGLTNYPGNMCSPSAYQYR